LEHKRTQPTPLPTAKSGAACFEDNNNLEDNNIAGSGTKGKITISCGMQQSIGYPMKIVTASTGPRVTRTSAKTSFPAVGKAVLGRFCEASHACHHASRGPSAGPEVITPSRRLPPAGPAGRSLRRKNIRFKLVLAEIALLVQIEHIKVERLDNLPDFYVTPSIQVNLVTTNLRRLPALYLT